MIHPAQGAVPPRLTDRRALDRQRARASEFLFHTLVRDDAKERLAEVNRSFTAPAIITAFAELWQKSDILSPGHSLGHTPAHTPAPRPTIVADNELLALAPNAHDLIIHALNLHWSEDIVGQLIQCRRALFPDGLFMGFLFGGRTLHELRACLAQAEVDQAGGLSPRVLPMADIRDLGGVLGRAGFALPVADSFTMTVRYRDLWHLMRDLRAMGEGNAMHDRRRTLTPPRLLKRADELYTAHYRDADGMITATFEIICLSGWAPSTDQPKPLRPGSAQKRLAEVLNTTEYPLPPTTKTPPRT